jgi:predicted MFS family arabinose efflux permease
MTQTPDINPAASPRQHHLNDSPPPSVATDAHGKSERGQDTSMYSHFRRSAGAVTALLTFVLIANLVPLMTVPTVLPAIQSAWRLDASQAAWVGSIYFAGYTLAAPVLASATDRIDGRWLLAGASVLGATASFAFGLCAHGFWLALVLRFVSGVAMAGVHMPGLKMLADRVHGPTQLRYAAVYTSSYALGNAGSSLVAGVVSSMFGWHATFLAAGVGALLAVPALALLSAVPTRAPVEATRPDIGSLVRNRGLVAYILGFAGNTWEVFAIRVWFVTYLSWLLRLPGNSIALPSLGVVAGLAALAGVPASIAVAELAARYRRSEVIMMTCLISVLVCLGLAATTGGNVLVVLPLAVLLQITSFADVGALAGGAVAATHPLQRGTALGLYATIGYASGFLGSVTVGIGIDQFGGIASTTGWTAAFVIMAFGSAVAGCAVWFAPDPAASLATSAHK